MGDNITALLGPTNTGKTRRAIDRMLEHRSGIIGLPLRLLAREVYERVSTRVGEQRVALVTGEEKRVPSHPDYWVCTVESMPTERRADFVCVDEIQLSADPGRGHAFTERLLSMRGTEETWWLGATTMAPLLGKLVPEARVATHPRFSELRHFGGVSLRALPPRTAVIAFSVSEVYALAERIRVAHGGTAVVLGALSPRTRNAQVALYESGEVQHMVATDAIGMGLNLDLERVVFSSLTKFDGRSSRKLTRQEVAQIAGRAGRYTTHGGFGTLRPLPPMSPGLVSAVEDHAFPPVERVTWRNHVLDFSSLEALIESLRRRPWHPTLTLVRQADDFDALLELSRVPDIRRYADSPRRLRLLWDVCRIPDFRRLLVGSHVRLLAKLFEQLTGPTEQLDEDWIARRIARLDDCEGTIDALTARLAFVRTWTYIAHRDAWLDDPGHWQGITRSLEDRFSDLLHARLTERFVQPRAYVSGGALPASRRPLRELPADHPFAALARLELDDELDVPDDATVAGTESWTRALLDAGHGAFDLTADGTLRFAGHRVGCLRRGPDLVHPSVEVDAGLGLPPGAAARVHRRLVAWVADAVSDLLSPLHRLGEPLGPALRGLVYQLERGLGTVDRRTAQSQIRELDGPGRRRLSRLGLGPGRVGIFTPAAVRADTIDLRIALWSLHAPEAPWPRPGPDAITMLRAPDIAASFYPRIGFVVRGPLAIRIDVLEALADDLRRAGRSGPFPLQEVRSTPPGCTWGQLATVVRSLGYHQHPTGLWTRRGWRPEAQRM